MQQKAARHTEPRSPRGSSVPSPAGGWRAGIHGRANCASCPDSEPARACPGAAATGGPAPSSGSPAGRSRCQKWTLGHQGSGGAQLRTLWPARSERDCGGLKPEGHTCIPEDLQPRDLWKLQKERRLIRASFVLSFIDFTSKHHLNLYLWRREKSQSGWRSEHRYGERAEMSASGQN